MQQATRPPGHLAPRAFNSRDYRDALGAFPSGVTVITTLGAEHPYGMTASSFTSVSLDPPLILVCVISGTEGSRTIARNGIFAVNILGADQEAISRFFAAKDRPRGWAAFERIPHHQVVTGAPILDGAAAYLDCTVAATHEAGDHVIFIGEVLALGHDPGVTPLVFHRAKYRFLGEG